MANKCSHPDCETALGLIDTDLGLMCGLHIQHVKDIMRGEDRLMEAGDRICELEARLAELSWKPITPENLPKVGDEVWDAELEIVSGPVDSPSYERCVENQWTYFRPINASIGAPDGK